MLLSRLIDQHREARKCILLGLHRTQLKADFSCIALRTVIRTTARIVRPSQQRGIDRRLCRQHNLKGRRVTDILEAEGHIELITRQQLLFRIKAQLQVQYRSPSHTQGLRGTVRDDITRRRRCAHLRFKEYRTYLFRRLQRYRQTLKLRGFKIADRPGHHVVCVNTLVTHSRTDIRRTANIQRHRRRACRPAARIAQVNKRRELRAYIDHTLRLCRHVNIQLRQWQRKDLGGY